MLVISHDIGYQEENYKKKIEEYAEKLGVKLVFFSKYIKANSSQTEKNFFTMEEIYKCTDLVTYPSSYEGFGNAFLEAIYYKKPIVVNRYSIYITDIEPKGFDLITINNIVTDETINKIKEVLKNEKRRNEMVNKNYELAKKYFSYEVLEELLIPLIRQLEKGW